MKKLVAGVATAAALSLGALSLTGAADAATPGYGPTSPVTHVGKDVNQAIAKTVKKKGHIGPKKAAKLKKKIKAAKKAGLISKAKAKKLLNKVKKHTHK